MSPSNSSPLTNSRVKSPTAAKAGASKRKARKSRAKPKPFIEKLNAEDNATFKALVIQYTGQSPPLTEPASCSCSSPPMCRTSDSSPISAHDCELGRSMDICSSDNAPPIAMQGCTTRSWGIPQTNSTYIAQVLKSLETLSLRGIEAEKSIPCTHAQSGHVSMSETQPTSQHMLKTLLLKILIGFRHPNEAECASSQGNKDPININNLLNLYVLTLLHDITFNPVKGGF
ncbi:hypothetical protein KP509_19G050300 [Ceratopteris richardii]|uniref:Uncharacterized protein n=1 Tax=Ceratopteris richardii TaxID=49495 RepID=A0A8T2SNY3_CERRI|nr:hypothetical protein KP509_19G050300 [Ceratopteris richardii]